MIDKNISDGHLTQKDIVQLLLHNAQHMVTREELKSDVRELRDDVKQDIEKVENQIAKVEISLKQDIAKVENHISKVETSLKQDNKTLRDDVKQDISKLETKISKVSDKFDKLQWLIVATLLTVVFKDYIISLFQ